MIVVVMGVSGAGKTVVGRALATQLGAEFLEGDDLHSRENIAKMTAGIPLSDQDRDPWLDAIAKAACNLIREDKRCVVTCSALKYAYRERLRRACPEGHWCFLLLDVPRATLAKRLAQRRNHFMSPKLLDSQLATLEPLRAYEEGSSIDAEGSPSEVVERARQWIEKRDPPGRGHSA